MTEMKSLKLPDGFNPANPDHMAQLERNVAKVLPGYGVYRVENGHNRALLLPKNQLTVSDSDGETVKTYRIDATGLRNVDKQVDSMEAKNPGLSVISVDMTSGYVRMQRLSPESLYARRLFAAALNLHPWEVRVFATQAHGWRVKLPDGFAYRASRYETPFQEAVETVGAYGWYFTVDTERNIITVIPAKPPTFPKMIPMPENVIAHPELRRSVIGWKLPNLGEKRGEPLILDWKDASGVGVGGQSGGGKSVVIDNVIFSFLAAGGRLYVCDSVAKSADFLPFKPFVAKYGWGCAGPESTLTVLRYLLEEVKIRAKVLKDNGVANWWELPDSVKAEYPLSLLVCDEISQYAVPPAKVPGDKDSPVVLQNKYDISIASAISQCLLKITQTARFAGICWLFAAQSFTMQSGLDPKIKANLQNRLLLGANPGDTLRNQVLKDPKGAPTVPRNIVEEGVDKGVGVAELEGQGAFVWKAFFEASTGGVDYGDMLAERVGGHVTPDPDAAEGDIPESVLVGYVPEMADRPAPILTPRMRGGDSDSVETLDVDSGGAVSAASQPVPDLSDGRGLRSATATAEYMGLLAQAKGM